MNDIFYKDNFESYTLFVDSENKKKDDLINDIKKNKNYDLKYLFSTTNIFFALITKEFCKKINTTLSNNTNNTTSSIIIIFQKYNKLFETAKSINLVKFENSTINTILNVITENECPQKHADNLIKILLELKIISVDGLKRNLDYYIVNEFHLIEKLLPKTNNTNILEDNNKSIKDDNTNIIYKIYKGIDII